MHTPLPPPLFSYICVLCICLKESSYWLYHKDTLALNLYILHLKIHMKTMVVAFILRGTRQKSQIPLLIQQEELQLIYRAHYFLYRAEYKCFVVLPGKCELETKSMSTPSCHSQVLIFSICFAFKHVCLQGSHVVPLHWMQFSLSLFPLRIFIRNRKIKLATLLNWILLLMAMFWGGKQKKSNT